MSSGCAKTGLRWRLVIGRSSSILGSSGRIAVARAGFFLDSDWEATERQHLAVLRLEPNNADWTYGIFLTYAGRFEEALAQLRHGLERWPTSTFVRYQIGLTGVCAGRFDEAAAQASELRSRFGDDVHATLLDAMALTGRGQYAAAVDLLESRRPMLLVNRATTFYQTLGYAAARAGNPIGHARLSGTSKRSEGRELPPFSLPSAMWIGRCGSSKTCIAAATTVYCRAGASRSSTT